MNFVADWKWVAKHSWSFWLMGIVALLDVGGVLFDFIFVGKISNLWFACGSLVLTIFAMVARLLYQRSWERRYEN